MEEEKKPRADPKHWAQPGKDDANMAEHLFYALMLCTTHQGRVAELNQWANKVVLEEFAATELRQMWKPIGAWPKMSNNISSAFEPLVLAHDKFAWPEQVLDGIGIAMQAWRGKGHVDGLTGHLLKDYVHKPRLSAAVTKKKDPPVRYKSWAVVPIARLLVDHGSKLRKLLKLDAQSEEAKPLTEVVEEQVQEIEELEVEMEELDQELTETKKALSKKTDAHRKLAQRNKVAGKAKTDAVRTERVNLKESYKQMLSETKQQLSEEAEAKAEAGVASEREKLVEQVKAAHRFKLL